LSPATGFGGKLVNGGEVVFLKIGVLFQNLPFGHPSAQPAKNVPYRDAQSSNTRFSSAFPRLNRDPVHLNRHVATSDQYATFGARVLWLWLPKLPMRLMMRFHTHKSASIQERGLSCQILSEPYGG